MESGFGRCQMGLEAEGVLGGVACDSVFVGELVGLLVDSPVAGWLCR